MVFGCADSRAPIEILFDVRPGDLFVLRNAGNTCTDSTGSLVGSMEYVTHSNLRVSHRCIVRGCRYRYAISQLNSRLIVVTGHTNCGAVTARPARAEPAIPSAARAAC